MPDDPSQWFLPIRGDEHILIGRPSPFRRIPANVDRKQAVILDGIRHAVEILDIAFGRLRISLTRLAQCPPKADDLSLIAAGVFLDAWAAVDAVDKFRQLYTGFPAMKRSAMSDLLVPLRELLSPFRELRNVGQHLINKAELVSSKGGAALGELSWLTGIQVTPPMRVFHCVLRPGTLRSEPTLPTEPILSTLDWPTDCICLMAAGHVGNLSQVRFEIAGRIRHFEAQLYQAFGKPEHSKATVINDFFGMRPVIVSEDRHSSERPELARMSRPFSGEDHST